MAMIVPPRNIFAFTAPGSQPAYISVNEADDGGISISVRSTGGVTNEIELSSDQKIELREALAKCNLDEVRRLASAGKPLI